MRKRAKKKLTKKAQFWADLKSAIEKANLRAQILCAALGHMPRRHVFSFNDCVCVRCSKTL